MDAHGLAGILTGLERGLQRREDFPHQRVKFSFLLLHTHVINALLLLIYGLIHSEPRCDQVSSTCRCLTYRKNVVFESRINTTVWCPRSSITLGAHNGNSNKILTLKNMRMILKQGDRGLPDERRRNNPTTKTHLTNDITDRPHDNAVARTLERFELKAGKLNEQFIWAIGLNTIQKHSNWLIRCNVQQRKTE